MRAEPETPPGEAATAAGDRGDVGLIFDVQGFAVHDGPGCRTLVFLSGCPLRCGWCANPEGQELRPRLLLRRSRCLGCGRCVEACPAGAVSRPRADEPPSLDRQACARCLALDCVDACDGQALARSGERYTVDQLMRVLLRDSSFWGAGGGVTFGGGEPLVQHRFLARVLDRCAEAYLHTAIETCGEAAREVLLDIARRVDFIFFDVKHADDARHRAGTGRGNARILANLAALVSAEIEARLVVRLALVPGFNDAPEQLEALADRLVAVGARELQLLGFHRLGSSKAAQLDVAAPYGDRPAATREQLEGAATIVRSRGLVCHVAEDAPF